MSDIEHPDENEPTLLEAVLRLQSDFRQQLAPLRVTPIQAGVILYLHRHPLAKVKDAAAAVSVRSPTITPVINDLVFKRWVTRHRSPDDRRALYMRLTQRGEILARRIKERIRDVGSKLAPQK